MTMGKNCVYKVEIYRKAQEVKFSLTEQLRGIREYKDTVTKDSVIRKIGKIVLDGSEKWSSKNDSYDNIKTNRFFTYVKDLKHIFGKQYIICDKLEYKDVFADEASISNDGKNMYIKIEKEKANTVEEFKQWLSKNPLTVLYVLEKEIKEELTEQEKQQLSSLQTHYPTTIVSNDANAEMEVTYVADTKNYVDRKIKETVTAQIQNTANLLSLMPESVQATMIENDTNKILEEVTQ